MEKNRNSIDGDGFIVFVVFLENKKDRLATFQSSHPPIFNRAIILQQFFLFAISPWDGMEEIRNERTNVRFKNAVVGIDPARVQTHRRRDNELRYISVFFIFVSRLAHAPLATIATTLNHLVISSPFPTNQVHFHVPFRISYRWSDRSRVE